MAFPNHSDQLPDKGPAIEAFFRCLAGACCMSCYSGGADFNADGDIGIDGDIESFFRVLAGGHC